MAQLHTKIGTPETPCAGDEYHGRLDFPRDYRKCSFTLDLSPVSHFESELLTRDLFLRRSVSDPRLLLIPFVARVRPSIEMCMPSERMALGEHIPLDVL